MHVDDIDYKRVWTSTARSRQIFGPNVCRKHTRGTNESYRRVSWSFTRNLKKSAHETNWEFEWSLRHVSAKTLCIVQMQFRVRGVFVFQQIKTTNTSAGNTWRTWLIRLVLPCRKMSTVCAHSCFLHQHHRNKLRVVDSLGSLTLLPVTSWHPVCQWSKQVGHDHHKSKPRVKRDACDDIAKLICKPLVVLVRQYWAVRCGY